MFVHIADERSRSAIARGGIRPVGGRVYAMPVLPTYFVSHQWQRELKRRGARTMVGVYFRVPDEELVLVGHYSGGHVALGAAQASGEVLFSPDPRGYEVIIGRKVRPKEVHAIRPVTPVVGWRYYPDAHGRRPCGCPMCVPRGEIRSRRLRADEERS